VSEIKFPLAFSAIGHAIGVALLILLMSAAPPVPEPISKGGIQIVFAPLSPPEPSPQAAPPLESPFEPEPPPPPVETPPPEPPPEPPVVNTEPPPAPEPPVVPIEPPPPAPEAPVAVSKPPPPPPPPHRVVVKRPPKPVPRREEMPPPTEAYTPPVPVRPFAPQSPPAPVAPPQTAMAATPVPARVPSPEAVAGYRALLSAWLESHKRYPDSARERGEQGHAVLRFQVDRSGRVLDYAVIASSGYPDLDQSVEEMMRGATLPPFPAGMPQPRMEVSVTIRFSLRR
jgi:protein TonB